ncbi:MAG: UTP--glucose-1-phosphate uridylyltransferase GalU [Bdellovibrionales bacterium]
MKIRKAVIPAAGLGTRLLPATKSLPKEMLPIVDKPQILYAVEEMMAAGITELVLVTGRGKFAIEDFFDTSYELEDQLEKSGKQEWLKSLRELRRELKVISIRQHQALGLGHAVLTASPVVGSEPFAVLLPDELMISKPGRPSATAQLARIYDDTQMSVVAVMEVPAEDVDKYGIVTATVRGPNLWSVQNVVEKPKPSEAPSRLALPGRYVFDAELFNCLREVAPGKGGEIQLTDGMVKLAQRKGLLGTTVEALRLDTGNKLGFLIATVELGLQHPDVAADFRQYLHERVQGRTHDSIGG